MPTEDWIKLHMPEVSNRILLLLSSKTVSQIFSVESRQKRSNEILALVKQPFTARFPKQSVCSVFFTSFVIQ
ncbi:MAG: hypothetical protein Tsb0026_21080 [Sulfuricaulis sp.]